MITVLTKNDCVQCTYTKKKLEEANAQFHEINITEQEAIQGLLKSIGITHMPVVLWTGFSPDKIRAIA